MKKIINILVLAFLLGASQMSLLTGCTDTGGDGIDSVIWDGSKNPENTSFRNPVWEPSLEGGTIVKGASMYVAVSNFTQWAPGLTYYCRTLNSSDLMSWSMGNDAFSIPDSIKPYITQRLNALSIDYARTVVGANYWMFYTVEGGDSICAATSITAAGPYTNRGAIMHAADVNSTTLSHPFFIVASTAFYLCYTTDDGTYIQRLRLNRVTGVSKQGAATKIAATGVTDVSIVRKSSSVFYMLFTVKNGESTEIHYARASKITGPYLDKSGNDVATSSAGETLITASDNIINPERPMRGFINQAGDYLFVAHNATEQGKETMQSGYARRPLFVTPVQIGEDEWLTATQVKKGWTKPRFE